MSNDKPTGRTSAQRAVAEALPDTTTQVVFIDSRTPDMAHPINGTLPGEQIFVLDSTQDGLDQISSILRADDLIGQSAISIIGHGALGEIDLGSAVIDDANLANDAAALSAIGASLAPGGDLALYACDTAADATGHQFIADFSAYAGGVDVAALTSYSSVLSATPGQILFTTFDPIGSHPLASFMPPPATTQTQTVP